MSESRTTLAIGQVHVRHVLDKQTGTLERVVHGAYVERAKPMLVTRIRVCLVVKQH